MSKPVLDAATLEQLLLGKLSPAKFEEVALQLESSEWFAEVASQIAPKDQLVELVRTHAGTDSTLPGDLRIEKLKIRLRQMRAQPQIDQTGVQTGPSLSRLPETKFSFLSPPQGDDELGRLNGYRVLKLLGEGGMGLVFLAEDVKLKRRLALKVMKPEVAIMDQHRQRFLREAQTAASVEHDHIIPIFRVDEENGVPYIAMPFLKGEPLDERLKRMPQPPIEHVMRFGRQIAEGLSVAHEAGLIHRDIKPGNIWLEAPQDRVKILDFGLARTMSGELNLTQSGVMMGTPAYMAPEQARGSQVDGRADLFSLGVMLYQMATGTRPFVGDDLMSLLTSLAMDTPPIPETINAEVPPALGQLVMQLLEKDAKNRPQTAREVADRLRLMEANPTLPVVEVKPSRRSNLDNTVVVPSPKPQVKSTSPPPKTNKKLLFGALGGIAMLVLAVIIIKITNKDGSETLLVVPEGAKLEFVEGKIDDLKEKLGGRIKDKIENTLKEKASGTTITPVNTKIDPVNVKIDPVNVKKEPSGISQPPKDDFVSLFNGKDLTGWTGIDGKTTGWSVKDGILISDGPAVGHLFSTKEYGDVHLRLEVRINRDGNSGLFARAPFVTGNPLGYEAQISPLPKNIVTGGIYRGGTSVKSSLEPPSGNEWFTLEMIVVKEESPVRDRVTVLINGKQTAEMTDSVPLKAGRLMLQKMDEKTRVEFRKVEVKELTRSASNGFVSLFNGKDFTGWQVLGFDDWSVKDGVLTAGGKGRGWLGTKENYTDFELELEYKLPRAGNSGIFLRASTAGALDGKDFIEIQLLDDSSFTVPDKNRTGAVFKQIAPDPAPRTAIFEWNTAAVKVIGNRVSVTINGVKCVDSEVDFPIKSGSIGLQMYDTKAEFRNIRVRSLSKDSKPLTRIDPVIGKQYAFLVGVNVYEDKKALGANVDLKFAEADVVKIESTLLGMGVPESQITTMTTSQPQGGKLYPSASQVRKRLEELASKLGENDSLLISFSGYEIQFTKRDDYALATADLHPTEKTKQFMLAEVYDILEKSKCKKVVVLIDSCRAGEISKQALVPKEPPKGITVIFGCSGGQNGYEDAKIGGGIVSQYFAKGIRGEADANNDKEVTWKELFEYLQKEVPKYAKANLKVEQLPSLFGDLPEGGFKVK